MFFLQRNGFAEKFDSEQRRLASMPGKTDDLLRRCLNMLDNVALQSFVAQTKIGSLGIELLLFEVIAVMTVEVTDRTDCLHHDLKFTRRSFQPDVSFRLKALYSKNISMSSPRFEFVYIDSRAEGNTEVAH